MNKALSNALFDIEGALFELGEISNALCVYHGRMEDELDIIAKWSPGGSPETRHRLDTVLSVLTLSQTALTNCRATLEDAYSRACAATRAQKTE